MTQYSSAADMHPSAPKVVEGNAALMDKSTMSWADYPVRSIASPETPTNPNPKTLFGNKLNQDSDNGGLFEGMKTAGGGGNSGAVVSPNPFGGLSAYQDADAKVGKLPQHSGLDSISVDESAFAHLEHKLSHKKGVTNPAGLAAKIGREKLGEKEMERRSIAGREK